jgi:hypothetical protein
MMKAIRPSSLESHQAQIESCPPGKRLEASSPGKIKCFFANVFLSLSVCVSWALKILGQRRGDWHQTFVGKTLKQIATIIPHFSDPQLQSLGKALSAKLKESNDEVREIIAVEIAAIVDKLSPKQLISFLQEFKHAYGDILLELSKKRADVVATSVSHFSDSKLTSLGQALSAKLKESNDETRETIAVAIAAIVDKLPPDRLISFLQNFSDEARGDILLSLGESNPAPVMRFFLLLPKEEQADPASSSPAEKRFTCQSMEELFKDNSSMKDAFKEMELLLDYVTSSKELADKIVSNFAGISDRKTRATFLEVLAGLLEKLNAEIIDPEKRPPGSGESGKSVESLKLNFAKLKNLQEKLEAIHIGKNLIEAFTVES